MLRVGGNKLLMNTKMAPGELDRHSKVYNCRNANMEPEIPWKRKRKIIYIFIFEIYIIKSKQQCSHWCFCYIFNVIIMLGVCDWNNKQNISLLNVRFRHFWFFKQLQKKLALKVKTKESWRLKATEIVVFWQWSPLKLWLKSLLY